MAERTISVVGLGYVGLPVAVAFAKHFPTIGFDISARRVEEIKNGHDRTGEVTREELAELDLEVTSDATALGRADFHIVAVPTPIDESKHPDLGPLLGAAKTVGEALSRGAIVVFESTVYPGATEEDCVPVLERASGLKAGVDFFVGYSPERINPGDREHRFTSVAKVVSGQDAATLATIAAVYERVIEANVYRAPTIRVAEAAKVIENTQRDLNIALMNELSLIFGRMGIDTNDVLAAAGTKWNFLPFKPGLVGGHCIGVDPYYLTYKATRLGYHPQVILAGRRINDDMGSFIADQTVKQLIRRGHTIRGGVATVLGMSFKENVPDLRNTRAIDIIRELGEYGMQVQIHDPIVEPEEALAEHGVSLTAWDALAPASCVVVAVAHRQYAQGGWELVRKALGPEGGVVADVKGMLPRDEVPEGVTLWRL